MKKAASHLGKFATHGLGAVSIPATIGRYQPVHKGHMHVLENLRIRSSILQNSSPEFSHLPPALIMIGSSGENRNLLKNPFTFEQRVEMFSLVGPWLPKTDDPRNNPAFLAYVGTYDNIKPPSLERMAEQLKGHCVKHNIPLEALTPLISIKADDKQDFQIYGKTYPKSHQMSVLAQGLGLRFFEEDVVDKEAIHATNIRKNMPANFDSLDPRVLRYIQKELMLAHLNSRDVGASQTGDKYTNAEEALKELVKEGRMLSLDVTKAQVVAIPTERKSLFLECMGSDYISAPTTTVTKPAKEISSTLQQSFEQVTLSEGDLIKGTVLLGKDQIEIKHGSLQMTIDPHILRDATVVLSDKEKNFLNQVNKSKDQDFARILQTAIDSNEIDLNATNSKGKTLLDLAAENGLIQTTQMLLDKGINFPIMARGPQNSSLHKAAMGKTKSLSSTYPDCAELGNILVEHSGKLSTSGQTINPPQARNNDDFEAKKEQLLRRDIFASNTVPTSEEKRQEFCKRIIDGAEVKKSSAVFLTITEDEKESHFLKKSKCVGVETKYGSDLFRALSRKHYGAKRELLMADDEGTISTLIKFDPNLSQESFLNRALKSLPNFDTGLEHNKEFLTGYSRMCGVMHVLGEPDRNLENFLVSETSGRPIKIDNGFLVNFQKYPFGDIYQNNGRAQSRNSDYPHEYVTYDVTPQDRFKIYGSAQSRDFLVCTLGGEKYQNMQALIDEAKFNFGQDENTANLTVLADSYVKAYNLGLSDALFDKIKTNISKPENKHLEAAFMSFMSGINDSINLANDDKFLDAYTEKYAAEGGENVGLLAQQCKKFFKENAREAQQQFGKLLDHFHELRNEPEYAADYKNNGNGIKPTSSNKLSVDNSLDRGCL